MPFLQFLNGVRDGQVEALNPSASLVVGSLDDPAQVHIRCTDQGIEGRHVQVYPGQGSFWLNDLGAGLTVLNMKRLKGSTEGLKDKDIFIIGTTFVKFMMERPAAGAAPAPAAPGGASPAQLEAAKREVEAAKAEVARLQQEGQRLQAQAQQADAAQKQVAQLQEAGAAVKRDLEQAKRDLEAAKRDLEQAKGDVARLEGDAGRQREERRALEEKKDGLEARVAALEGEIEKAKADAAAEVEKAKTDAASDVRQAKAAAERETEELRSATDATRAALEALRAREEARARDPLAALEAPSDLQALVDALGLPEAVRTRLDQAIRTAVDREALRRAAGPVVPLRGLRVPGVDRDVEGALAAARAREAQAEAARTLGLHDLDAAELERLVGLARA